MDENQLSVSKLVGAGVVVGLLAALAITGLGAWPTLTNTLEAGSGSGWAQAFGAVLAIIFSVRAATDGQRRQEKVAQQAAEQAYDDLLLAAGDLMDKCAFAAAKVFHYVGTPSPLDLIDMTGESSVLSAALQKIDFGRLRGSVLTEAVLIGIAAEAIFVRTLMQEEEASARRDLNWALVRHQAGKAIHHLARGKDVMAQAYEQRSIARVNSLARRDIGGF